MSRERYYFDLNRPRGWMRKRWARWLFAVLGVAYLAIGLGAVLLDAGFSDGPNWMLFAQSVIWGPLMFIYATGFGERFFGRFVDISLRSVRWRLAPPDGSLSAKYYDVPLARVRDIRVHLLRIDFVMDDGTVHRMPLGELPYEVVQEVKRRFEGRASLAGATAGAITEEASVVALDRV